MTTQPVHDRLDRTPTWMVQGVFDPDVKGQDFSYTIGLHDRGLPELHLWASPTDGDDPGDDWAFSHRDRGLILNELALKLIDGGLGPGSTVVRKFDQGLATVTFEVQPPGDRDALEALGIAPDAQVLPLTWSLERSAVGPLSPLPPQDLQTAFDEYAGLVRSLPARRPAAPDGWDLPPIPRLRAEGRFGPRTPVVLARAAQLWSTDDLAGWIEAILAFASRGSLMWPATVARALARSAGRAPALAELEREGMLLVEHVLEARSQEWRRCGSRHREPARLRARGRRTGGPHGPSRPGRGDAGCLVSWSRRRPRRSRPSPQRTRAVDRRLRSQLRDPRCGMVGTAERGAGCASTAAAAVAPRVVRDPAGARPGGRQRGVRPAVLGPQGCATSPALPVCRGPSWPTYRRDASSSNCCVERGTGRRWSSGRAAWRHS